MTDELKRIRVADLNDVVIFVTPEEASHGFTEHKKVGEKLRERVSDLKENYEEIMSQILAMIQDSKAVEASDGYFRLEEISVGLAFDAKGKLGFIAGVEAGVSATVTVKLARP